MYKSFVIGRLTRDATVNEVGGNSVCNFDVATDTSFKDPSSQGNVTNFIRVAAWNKLGTACARLTKGQMVGVVGDTVVKSYKTREGANGFEIDIRADTVQFLSPKKDNNSGGADLFE